MTPLIWMLSWLPVVLPAGAELPMPINVTVTSLNFSYILKWEAGPGTPEGVHYKVTYMPDRLSSWKPVSSCERVQKPLVCNLTAEFSNMKETYFTSVTAHLGQWASPAGRSKHGFKPISQLSLPLLSVVPSGRDLTVDLQSPVEGFGDIYKILPYKLQIRSNTDELESVTIQALSHRWEKLAPGRRYCVTVRFSNELENLYSNFSRTECAVIPTTISADPLISGALCSLVIVMVIFFIMLILTGFICLKRRPLPPVLTTIHNLDQVRVQDHCIISSLLSVEPPPPSAGKKRSSLSSSDESDEDGETESVSTEGAYTERVGANPLSSSSSCLSQPKPPAELSSNQLSSQHNAQISTGSPSRAGLELRTDCGGRAKEKEAQDVNLLTLTFGRVEQEEEQGEEQEEEAEEEQEEKSELSVQEVEFDPVLPTEDTTEAVCEDEEEVCGYMGRPGFSLDDEE